MARRRVKRSSRPSRRIPKKGTKGYWTKDVSPKSDRLGSSPSPYSKKKDKQRFARAPGRRVAWTTGDVYYESRRNRADKSFEGL